MSENDDTTTGDYAERMTEIEQRASVLAKERDQLRRDVEHLAAQLAEEQGYNAVLRSRLDGSDESKSASDEEIGEYAERLADVAEWARKLGEMPDEKVERMPLHVAMEHLGAAVENHVPWLLARLYEAASALNGVGVPDNGWSPAQRVRWLSERAAKYGASHRESVDRARAFLDAEKLTKASALHGLDVLRRAAVATATTLGEALPEDAGPEAIAAALRQGMEKRVLFRCVECGAAVVNKTGEGRTIDGAPVPADQEVPTCTDCGETFWNPVSLAAAGAP